MATDEWTFVAELRLPSGWKYGTALPVASEAKDVIAFKPVSLTTLVDSPVIAGAHFRSIPLGGGAEPTQIDMVADSEAALAMRPQEVKAYEALVAEASALFGARHYSAYHFLVSLSDHIGHFGLEHHASSDCRTGERAFIDDTQRRNSAGLLPHEFVLAAIIKPRRGR